MILEDVSDSGLGAPPAASQVIADTRAWVDRFRPGLELALAQFLASAEWPERERFRRRLIQRGLDQLSLDELLREMPRSSWHARQVPPDRVVLSLQVLRELPEAADLLDVCVAVIQRAYALYISEDDDDPVLHSDDPLLAAASHGDARLLLCAREVLTQHPPDPLGGGTSGTDSTEWTRALNEAAMPAFKNTTTLHPDLAAQERIISEDPYRRARAWTPTLPATRLPGLHAAPAPSAAAGNAPACADLFVIMPFSDPWSDGTYALIRRAVRQIDTPEGALDLYRADEIAEPGQITQQVKEAIGSAHVVIADITHVNPNVMWELGYADGLGKTIVILNQDPQSSPFDMVDRRQVAYNPSPTDKDQENLTRHLIEALRTGHGLQYQARADEGQGRSVTLLAPNPSKSRQPPTTCKLRSRTQSVNRCRHSCKWRSQSTIRRASEADHEAQTCSSCSASDRRLGAARLMAARVRHPGRARSPDCRSVC